MKTAPFLGHLIWVAGGREYLVLLMAPVPRPDRWRSGCDGPQLAAITSARKRADSRRRISMLLLRETLQEAVGRRPTNAALECPNECDLPSCVAHHRRHRAGGRRRTRRGSCRGRARSAGPCRSIGKHVGAHAGHCDRRASDDLERGGLERAKRASEAP